MFGKTDWNNYLHKIRTREVEIIRGFLQDKTFIRGLELGAGDGYQTTLLAPLCRSFISSDLNFERLKERYRLQGVEYRKLDADNLENTFSDGYFDFIFSSNMLEHLSKRESFLTETHRMLSDDGYAIHVVPGRGVKLAYIFLFYPHLATLIVDRFLGVFKGKKLLRGKGNNFENNINAKNSTTWFKKIFFPSIHGSYFSHRSEYKAWGKEQWSDLFLEHNFSIVGYAKGPVFSGYGFGINVVRKIMEKLGFTSEHVFFLKKMGTFERMARDHTAKALPHAYFYEREKFIKDWLTKKQKTKQFLSDFIKAVGDPFAKKVLDVGFGNGIILSEFAEYGVFSYGVEIDKELETIAQRTFAERGVKGDLVLYDGKHFPFDDNFFDFAYSTSVLEHMSHPDIVIGEVARTLKPGGKFYLSFPNKYNLKESHTGLWGISLFPRWFSEIILNMVGSKALDDWNLHFISFFDMRRMARDAGLVVRIDTSAPTVFRRFIKKSLKFFGIHYSILLKTIIVVLEKPNQ